MTMFRSKATLIALLAALAAVAVATYAKSASVGAAAVSTEAVVHEAYPFNKEDLRLVVGTASNVFVGHVEERSGSDKVAIEGAGKGYPISLFSVRVGT